MLVLHLQFGVFRYLQHSRYEIRPNEYYSRYNYSDAYPVDVKYGFELKNKEPSANAFQSTERSQQTAQVTVLISCETLDIKNEWLKDIKVLVKDHQVAEAKRRAVAQGMDRVK